jgi:hypothetical protein
MLRVIAVVLVGAGLAACVAQKQTFRPDIPLEQQIKHDRQEDDPRLRKAFEEADAYAKSKTYKHRYQFGIIHEVWRYKKDYLLHNYGIHWKDPAQLNPWLAFD